MQKMAQEASRIFILTHTTDRETISFKLDPHGTKTQHKIFETEQLRRSNMTRVRNLPVRIPRLPSMPHLTS
jgi:hypothetical protein